MKTFEPHLLYTWAKTVEDNECAVAVYAIDKVIQPNATDTIYIANGCTGQRTLVELEGTYRVQILNCYGEETESFSKAFTGITPLAIPVGGIAILKK